MDKNWTTKGTFYTRPEGKRGVGRPKLRGAGVVWTRISRREDLEEPGIKQGRVEDTLEEDQGPHRPVKPMMMMVG
jgi:hypothetical protein